MERSDEGTGMTIFHINHQQNSSLLHYNDIRNPQKSTAMKKLMLLLAILAGVFCASARDNYSHDSSVLPVAAQTVLKDNFKAKVSHIKINKDFGRITEFDVVLTDGSEITFDSKGNWKDIEMSRNASVPSAFIPTAISTYVKANQKNVKITGIEKNRSGYDVELSNGVEMKFNSEGRFQRYDD